MLYITRKITKFMRRNGIIIADLIFVFPPLFIRLFLTSAYCMLLLQIALYKNNINQLIIGLHILLMYDCNRHVIQISTIPQLQQSSVSVV